jgi:uncharacterized protein YecE (DUF72 family)
VNAGRHPESPPLLRIGTCSWKYDSWKGLVYDPNRSYRPDDYLADYARHYSTVEIDQWFWSLFPSGVRLPDPSVARRYAGNVPDDFVFTVKAPNALTLTHHYVRQPAGSEAFANRPNDQFLSLELLDQVLARLRPLGGKLGSLMFQFEYLNRQKMPSQNAFLQQLHGFLARAPRDVPYAIETRNPNYLGEPFFRLLEEHRIAFVYLEGYFMPPIREVFERFRPAVADHCVIRLHGPDRKGIEQETGGAWNRIVSPHSESIQAAVEIYLANREHSIRTYVNVNNHFEGSAPLTIQRILERLRTAGDGPERAPHGLWSR